ncbi:hypothetical protein CXB51_033974 [Gossypium anomalum]|uniref:Integrase catalytic domain-containing protein n=1 Tax=Gossypium anomalum TaxID=47600 RepID=A0A8J6CGJ9_9ROSI|nr:hypothetical protein CXB51_033974 [Gossypium anomalum]
MSDKCFEINWSGDSVHVASTEDTKLWHQRLGHANFRSIAQMASKKMVENFTKSVQSEDVCEVCQIGKQARLPFPANTSWRISTKLELVHSDVCGPMKTESLNGSKYFILFIDDYTRFSWIYFLKHKSEVAQVFVKFKAATEIETGLKLKTIRTDNGTEYTSAQFQALCNKAGVKHQLTNVYTSQQNRVSERKNRSLLDMARCLLFEKKLPKNLWAEVVNTAVYLQNRLPTKALEQKTPFEGWFGFKPSVEHLRVFGCLCYAHIPAVKRDKLSERAQLGILMGYSTVKKGYRILDPLTNKIQNKGEPEATSENLIVDQTEGVENDVDMDLDDEPVRGTRTLIEIYERAHMAQIEPSSFEEAKADEGWRQAKQNADGSLNKLKARLVVKGFSQKYGLDYFETYAPVARLDTIRLIVAYTAHMHWNVYQLDVKSAFLNGILEEEIYVEQPQRFEVPSKKDMVCKLRKALYGLKQAPRAWYARIDTYLLSLDFQRSFSEPTLYIKKNNTETQLVVSLYVYDLLVTGGDEAILTDFKTKMKKMFEMIDLGLMTYFLGMEVSQKQGGIFLKQKSFALKALTKFSILNCKPTPTPTAAGLKLSSQEGHEEGCETTYRSLIGCLLYLTATRLDTCLHKAEELKLKGYTDSDWAGSKDDMKSTSAEAEYVAAASAVNQAIWLRKILANLNLFQEGATEILCDNKSAVAIAKNPVFHGRTKHFDIKLHVIREMEQACEIKLVHCNLEDQIIDILTKGLSVSKFNKSRKLMGVCSMELKEEC